MSPESGNVWRGRVLPVAKTTALVVAASPSMGPRWRPSPLHCSARTQDFPKRQDLGDEVEADLSNTMPEEPMSSSQEPGFSIESLGTRTAAGRLSFYLAPCSHHQLRATCVSFSNRWT
jgi:hypothetical protein